MDTCILCIFDQINAGFLNIRDFFQKHLKILLMLKFQSVNVTTETDIKHIFCVIGYFFLRSVSAADTGVRG